MSDFINELWNEILNRHWAYFNTEESITKLENRKRLEDCLKKFLCIAQHNEKFMLKETSKVLENSILNLENFSAQKAITAFESITQYATNLNTKPWRKEFRILKMYSGFYQHEIKSNLFDAEVLFEGMGYRRLSADKLILDWPICPDQVGNVSRDAMTAYVELQIIKHIHTGLDAIGIKCSWLDIYRYRERYTGDASKAVKDLTYSFEEKRYRAKQKAFTGVNYGYMDAQLSSNRQFCPAQCRCNVYQHFNSLYKHRPILKPNDTYYAPEHHRQSSTKTNSHYSNMFYPTQHQYPTEHRQLHHPGASNDNASVMLPQMSHSRSLEHNSEPGNHNVLPHRHSFDHQQQGCTAHRKYHPSQQQQQHYYQHINQPSQNFYDSTYDCIDGNSLGGGSSTISYAAVAANGGVGPRTMEGGGINCNLHTSTTYSHPYNVSGNRFPLPINISNQLSAYDNLPSTTYSGPQEPPYALISDPHMYSSLYTNAASHVHGMQNSLLVDGSIERQRSFQSDQLINFEDPTVLPPTTPQQQFDPLNQYRLNFEPSDNLMDNHCNMRNVIDNPLPPPSTSNCRQHCGPSKPSTNDDVCVYAKPTPKESRKQNAINLRKYCNSGERGDDVTDMSYESANDEFGNLPNGNERNQRISPTQFKKNQDGVGSSECWSYVYQKLEKNDYSKESDLLVQSLDLDSLNINNDASPSQSSSAEKRSYYFANEKQQQRPHQQSEAKQRSGTSENAKNLSKSISKLENSIGTNSNTNNFQKKKSAPDNNGKKIRSSLKQTSLTSKPINNIDKTQPKTNDNKSLPKTMNNNNNDFVAHSGNGTTQPKKMSSSTVNMTKKSQSIAPTNAASFSAQNVTSSAGEWSCSTCTFLNPDSKQVCEACCHSKNFRFDSSATSKDKGATSLAPNTPTCA